MDHSAQLRDGQRRGKRWAIIFLFATFFAFLYAGRNLVAVQAFGRQRDWTRDVFYQFIYWYVWALLTPIILWYAARFRIDRTNWKRVVLLLVVFGLLIAPLQGLIEASLAMLFEWGVRRTPPAELTLVVRRLKVGIAFESFSNLTIYGLIVGVHYSYDYYRKYRERELKSLELEGRLAQAELQNLKTQLQPHFLFNTLHTISVLMMRDVAAANRMLIRLSDLLRLTLENVGVQEVSLKEELDFLKGYLDIEQTRFQDRLQVTLDVDPSLLDARVPNLLLQPLVENAIRHGIARQPGAGLIEISVTREEANLWLQVRDNGPGLPAEPVQLNRRVGLTNTEARLRQLYGAAFKFEIANVSAGGVRATVVIPFRKVDRL